MLASSVMQSTGVWRPILVELPCKTIGVGHPWSRDLKTMERFRDRSTSLHTKTAWGIRARAQNDRGWAQNVRRRHRGLAAAKIGSIAIQNDRGQASTKLGSFYTSHEFCVPFLSFLLTIVASSALQSIGAWRQILVVLPCKTIGVGHSWS